MSEKIHKKFRDNTWCGFTNNAKPTLQWKKCNCKACFEACIYGKSGKAGRVNNTVSRDIAHLHYMNKKERGELL